MSEVVLNNCISCVIDEARCCSAKYAAEYASHASTGTETDEMKYRFMSLNAFIRILTRYEIQQKNFCKKNKSVSLNTRDTGICLSEDDVAHIIEQIKLLCATCNCNCN